MEKKGHIGVTPIFADQTDREYFEKDYNSTNTMLSIFQTDNVTFSSELINLNFRKTIIKNLINLGIVEKMKFKDINYDLSRVHEIIPEIDKELDEHEFNNTIKKFYDFDTEVLELYNKFVLEKISPLFPDKIYFQKTPSFRFHFPIKKKKSNNMYHTDVMLGHPPKEINIWVSITDAFLSNSLRFMNLEKSLSFINECEMDFENFAKKVQYDKDFISKLNQNSKSLDMKCGQFIVFDSRCLHCTQLNITNKTRVSMDIRVIQEKDYNSLKRDYTGTGRRKIKFIPGEYYNKGLI